jgi:hypothetical protein
MSEITEFVAKKGIHYPLKVLLLIPEDIQQIEYDNDRFGSAYSPRWN